MGPRQDVLQPEFTQTGVMITMTVSAESHVTMSNRSAATGRIQHMAPKLTLMGITPTRESRK